MQAAKVWSWLEIQPFWSYLEIFDNWNYTGNTFQIKNILDFINSMYSTFIQQTSSNRRVCSWFLTHFESFWRICGILGVPDRAHAYLNLELNPLIFRTLTGLPAAYSSGSNSELSINLYSPTRIIETFRFLTNGGFNKVWLTESNSKPEIDCGSYEKLRAVRT